MMRDEGRVGRSYPQLFTAILREEMTALSAVGSLILHEAEERPNNRNHSQMPPIPSQDPVSLSLSLCLCSMAVMGYLDHRTRQIAAVAVGRSAQSGRLRLLRL